MKSRIPIELVVAILAGFSCLVSWPGLDFPVWALFIGWAWYFALGTTPSAMKKIYPSIFPGAFLAAVCIWLINTFSGFMHPMLAMIIPVTITVFLLMMALRIPFTSCSLVGFNAYSTVFAVYYGGFYHQSEILIKGIVLAMIWGIVGNSLGPLFGYMSVLFTFPKSNYKADEHQ